MKTFFTILFACVVTTQFVVAQTLTPQVFSSTGNFSTAGNYSLSATIGEPVVHTFSTTGYILTQGFQQSEVKGTMVEEVLNDVTVQLYPNPAGDYVNVLITSDKSTKDVKVQLYDVLGREMNVQVTNVAGGTQRLVTFNLTGLAATMYFVTVTNGTKEKLTFKVNKIN